MISNVELQYVQGDPAYIPFPGVDYARSVIDNLEVSINIFKEKYLNKKYSLILSNGEEVHFSVMDKNLSHLLGVDHKTLVSPYMIDYISKLFNINPDEKITSYRLLQLIIDNGDKVIYNDKEKDNRKLLNYYKLMVKCSSFNKISDFKDLNFGFINFDRDTYRNLYNPNYMPNSTKYIFTPNDEALMPYNIMGLVQNNGQEDFVPETLLAPLDYQNFIDNQELLLPVQLLINDDNNLEKTIVPMEDKLKILNMYYKILNENNINAFINILNDYGTILRNESIKKKTK